ncbi:MAG: TonB-dependent receptor [Acidobacteria bacterium]|nr:TonB-dependent receptor [Acidobacteriota bacterium]
MNAFVQDEITLIPNRLRIIPGTKLEREQHSGWNVQPSLRLLWTPKPENALWIAVSRALRTPSDLEVETRINSAVVPGPSGQLNLISVFGNEDFETEKLLAYEMGYRVTPTRRFSLDVAAFYNVYHDLQTTEPSAPFFESSPAPPHLVIAQRFANLLKGETYGAELVASWNVNSRWSLNAAYSRLEIQLHLDPKSQSMNAEQAEQTSPKHQFQFRSHLSLPRNVEWDTSLHYVSALNGLAVPAYTRLDTQMTWSPSEFSSFAIGAQNLLSPRHLEFGNFRQIGVIGQAERNFFGKLTWQF